MINRNIHVFFFLFIVKSKSKGGQSHFRINVFSFVLNQAKCFKTLPNKSLSRRFRTSYRQNKHSFVGLSRYTL